MSSCLQYFFSFNSSTFSSRWYLMSSRLKHFFSSYSSFNSRSCNFLSNILKCFLCFSCYVRCRLCYFRWCSFNHLSYIMCLSSYFIRNKFKILLCCFHLLSCFIKHSGRFDRSIWHFATHIMISVTRWLVLFNIWQNIVVKIVFVIEIILEVSISFDYVVV